MACPRGCWCAWYHANMRTRGATAAYAMAAARAACRAAHHRRSNGCGTSAGVLPWSPLWTAGAAGLLRLARVAVARVGLTAHYVPPFPWALGSTCLLSNSVLECVPPSNR